MSRASNAGLLRLLPLGAALLFTGACETTPAPETTVNRALMALSLPNARYETILIVGATPDRESDRMIEERLRRELGKRREQPASRRRYRSISGTWA